jgi:hypothetical protein
MNPMRARTRSKRTTPATPPRLTRPPAIGRAATPGVPNVVEGHVRGVDGGVIHAVLATGEAVVARAPAHVDLPWLQAASRVAPVEAVFVPAQPSGTLVLWGVFPGKEHEAVRVDVRIRGREVKIDAESVQVGTEKAQLRLERDGNVSLRGRDVTSHARRVNRIKGGSVRLN